TLTANGGDVGSSASPLLLQSGQTLNDKVRITASGAVYIEEVDDHVGGTDTDNLRLEKIDAGGIVWVKVDNGDLVDANDTATRDTRTEQELTTGLWDQMSLTADTGANDKVDMIVDTAMRQRTADYQQYWAYRHAQSDGGAVFDESFVVTLSDD